MSTHQIVRLGTRPGMPLLPVLRGVVATLRRAGAARRARRHLQGLDDRILRDIGISRWEIGSAVHHDRR
jgi:uncharacterized protein YjiS (DUF1127 family)